MNRLHIGFYGKCNAGKSSIINYFTGQNVSIVSDIAGTTTDPIYKVMEVHGIGPVTIIDTAGIDDEGELGEARVKKTWEASMRTDIALMIFFEEDIDKELFWVDAFKRMNTPILPIINVFKETDVEALQRKLKAVLGKTAIVVNPDKKIGKEEIKQQLIKLIEGREHPHLITGGLVSKGDTVLLVMPQDESAPKGRLILPEVQTIREILDIEGIPISIVPDSMEKALMALKNPPQLVITDSQVFKEVYDKTPKESKITSFSILYSAYKGDLKEYTKGVLAIDKLTEHSKVLIAECCTHIPQGEDIGRVKIPNLLRRRISPKIDITVSSGTDYPVDLSSFDLIIQCGGCMFNRKHILSRINRAKSQRVPITNYGIFIAYMNGILDKVALPK